MMRAARYHGQEDIRIEQIPKAECGHGQIRVSETTRQQIAPQHEHD